MQYNQMIVILILCIIVLLVTIITKIIIVIQNKNGIETVQFYPPEGMNPARLGYFLDNKVDIHDVIGLIVYMEHKGYLHRGVEKKDKEDVVFLYKDKKPKDEKVCVKKFYDLLFQDCYDKIPLGDPDKFDIDCAIDVITNSIENDLAKNPLFDPGAKIFKLIIFIILTIIFAVFHFFMITKVETDVISEFIVEILGITCLYFFAGKYIYTRAGILYKKQYTWKMRLMLATFIFIFTLMFIMFDAMFFDSFNKTTIIILSLFYLVTFINFGLLSTIKWRNNAYADLLGRVKGFKNFITCAEKDKIEALAEEEPQLFYDVLPYSYVFGVTDKWIKSEYAMIGEELIEEEINDFFEEVKSGIIDSFWH